VFVVSAIIAGIGGALYVRKSASFNPSEFAPINFDEVVIWVGRGGRAP